MHLEVGTVAQKNPERSPVCPLLLARSPAIPRWVPSKNPTALLGHSCRNLGLGCLFKTWHRVRIADRSFLVQTSHSFPLLAFSHCADLHQQFSTLTAFWNYLEVLWERTEEVEHETPPPPGNVVSQTHGLRWVTTKSLSARNSEQGLGLQSPRLRSLI